MLKFCPAFWVGGGDGGGDDDNDDFDYDAQY
jgi:hypothetical protein